MKKTLLSIAVFVSILVPSVTFASWYNPFSWFRKAPVSVVVPVETVATQTATAPVALPAPKPVFTNTITVENPKLQAQINTLIQSNTDLQVQLASLTTKYNVLVTQNASLTAQVNSLTTENATLKTQPAVISQATQCKVTRDAKIKDLFQQIVDARTDYSTKIATIEKLSEPLELMNGQESVETNNLNLLLGALQSQIDQAKLNC